jgi:hypothetical protein
MKRSTLLCLALSTLSMVLSLTMAHAETNGPPSSDPKPDAWTAITTLNGRTYTNCILRRVDPDGITVRHSKGLAKLLFTELPEEMRGKYGYDPEKAQAYSRHVSEKTAESWARRQEEWKRQKEESDSRRAMQDVVESIAKQRMAVAGDVLQITDDGVLLSGSVTLEESLEVDPTDPVRRIDGPTMRKVTRLKNVTAKYEPVFIVGIGAGLHDGASWAGAVYPAGTYRYTSVQGVTKTVKRFATTAEGAATLQMEE